MEVIPIDVTAATPYNERLSHIAFERRLSS